MHLTYRKAYSEIYSCRLFSSDTEFSGNASDKEGERRRRNVFAILLLFIVNKKKMKNV